MQSSVTGGTAADAAHGARPAALPVRPIGLAVAAVLVGTVAVILADGLPRAVAAVLLVAVPTVVIARAPVRWGVASIAILTVAVLAASTAITTAHIRESHGAVLHLPVGGNSDQIDFTIMAWTWAEHSVVGSTPGGPAAEQVVQQHQASAEPASDVRNLERWEHRAGLPDRPGPYGYRALAYPVLLGTLWKATGDRPETAAALNLVLLVCAVGVLTFGLARLWSPAAGAAAGLLLAVSTEPLRWAGQALSETLTVLLSACAVVALALLSRRPTPGRWPLLAGYAALGLSLGLLALTKQMFLFAGLGALAVLVASGLAGRLRPRGSHLAGSALAGGVLIVVISPWLLYNLQYTGHTSLATGTAGWHDMPASYSQEYLDRIDRVVVRERIFDAYGAMTGTEPRSEIERALVGRQLWWEQAGSGEFLPRLPELVALKVARTLRTDALGWATRIAAVGSLVVVWRSRVPHLRVTALLLLALPGSLLLFIAATVEAGSRLMVTGTVFLAAIVGLAVYAAGERWVARGSGGSDGIGLRQPGRPGVG